MRSFVRCPTALLLAVALAPGGVSSAYAAPQYDDFDAITSHVELAVSQQLGIGNPAKNLSTSSDAFYITGTSNPGEELYLNGNVVADRGSLGSFGVYVPLSPGDNLFTFTQPGGAAQAVTITKGAGGVYTTSTITNAYPAFPSAYRSGEPLLLQCTAPSGAAVTATYGGQSHPLAQVALAQDGVPALFRAEVPALAVSAPQNSGTVQYTLHYQGNTQSLRSVGSLYLYPAHVQPLVRVTDTSSAIFATSNVNGGIMTVARVGAIDSVVAQTEDCYQLGMGGWIYKDTVTPILSGSTDNTLSAVTFSQTDYGERYTLAGTTSPIATSWQTGSSLYVELHHTHGDISLPTHGSRLFSSATVTPQPDSLLLEFTLAEGQSLWGHSVEYKDGVTTIYCKYKPSATGGPKPLTNIIIGLDPGHGGPDPGAFGTAWALGPTEKDINYATALGAKKRLEALGATVLMTPRKETKSSFYDRMQPPMDGRADLFLSLHCNSVAGSGLRPNGVEVYYYYNRSKGLADALLSSITAETGRMNRGAKNASYRVTLNTLTPAVLVEMGFISNPREYDAMCTKQSVFQVANAVGNAVVGYLS